MIRFTTAQLSQLPTRDCDCTLVLFDGKTVPGRFHLHRANPYIGGRELVGWIKTWVPEHETLDIRIEQGKTNNHLILVRNTVPSVNKIAVPEQKIVRNQVLRFGANRNRQKRKVAYETFERDPNLRKIVLAAWKPECQVNGCTFYTKVPRQLMPAIVEVHHLDHVVSGGSDSPTNLCLLCANHHRLAHKADTLNIEDGGDRVLLSVGTFQMRIQRDLVFLQDLLAK